MRECADYYLWHGTRMVWLVYPEKRIVEVYQPNADVQILLETDELTGGDVLPGFMLAVSVIFAN